MVIYCNPNNPLNTFADKFFDFYREINSAVNNGSHVLFAGDFNDNLLCQYDKQTALFTNNLYANNLIPCITLPTRVTDYSSTLIDNIFTSNTKIIYSSVLLSDITDHFQIVVAIDTGKRKITPTANKT